MLNFKIKSAISATLFVVLGIGSIQAQSFFPLKSLDQRGNAFFAEGDTVEMSVSNLVYQALKREQITDFVICYQQGSVPQKDFLTVARKSDLHREVKEVEKVEKDQNQYLICFTDSGKIRTLDAVYFALQPGQKLEITEVTGLTQNFLRLRTVSRSTPVGVKDIAMSEQPQQQQVVPDTQEPPQAERPAVAWDKEDVHATAENLLAAFSKFK
ncbi:MAG: hypothetical protein MJ212_03165 [Alphaproteobacteria bacterium]|nr:hypothetical protein [Alphaproteobacteria bacterium]